MFQLILDWKTAPLQDRNIQNNITVWTRINVVNSYDNGRNGFRIENKKVGLQLVILNKEGKATSGNNFFIIAVRRHFDKIILYVLNDLHSERTHTCIIYQSTQVI